MAAHARHPGEAEHHAGVESSGGGQGGYPLLLLLLLEVAEVWRVVGLGLVGPPGAAGVGLHEPGVGFCGRQHGSCTRD